MHIHVYLHDHKCVDMQGKCTYLCGRWMGVNIYHCCQVSASIALDNYTLRQGIFLNLEVPMLAILGSHLALEISFLFLH